MKRVTINDVARSAGVSIKSVSRVINKEPNVRDSLREKVEVAIQQLGYIPNVAARSLAAGRSFTLGVLFDNPSPNYTLKVQEGAYAACKRFGYQLIVEQVDTESPGLAQAMRAMLQSSRVDGMIISPPATDCEAILTALEDRKMPYARISPGKFPGRSPSVGMDDAGAAGEVADHLWGLGHRRFAIINGPASHAASGWRREGFLRALAARGLDTGSVLEMPGGFGFMSGLGAGLELFRRQDRPSGIFAANDDMAAGVLAAAAQLGLHVPKDLSVVGFDDSWIAQSVWPALTTIHQPIAEMADAAAELLIERKQGQIPDINLPHRLVVRLSTGLSPS